MLRLLIATSLLFANVPSVLAQSRYPLYTLHDKLGIAVTQAMVEKRPDLTQGIVTCMATLPADPSTPRFTQSEIDSLVACVNRYYGLREGTRDA